MICVFVSSNDKNKQLISEKGYIGPLVKLLWSSRQIAALEGLVSAVTTFSSLYLFQDAEIPRQHILNFKRFSSDYIVDVRSVAKLYKNSEESYKVDVYCHALGGGEGWQDVSVQRLISAALCNICGNNSVNQRQAREVCIFKVI